MDQTMLQHFGAIENSDGWYMKWRNQLKVKLYIIRFYTAYFTVYLSPENETFFADSSWSHSENKLQPKVRPFKVCRLKSSDFGITDIKCGLTVCCQHVVKKLLGCQKYLNSPSQSTHSSHTMCLPPASHWADIPFSKVQHWLSANSFTGQSRTQLWEKHHRISRRLDWCAADCGLETNPYHMQDSPTLTTTGLRHTLIHI